MRKIHRYLGLVLGLQFLAWTIGGLYFSWTDINEIRSDDIRKAGAPLALGAAPIALSRVGELAEEHAIDVMDLKVIDVLGRPHYQLKGASKSGEGSQYLLVDAQTGKVRPPLNEQEALTLAKRSLTVDAQVEAVKYIERTGDHHEYRGRALPAYAIKFGGPINATAYVATELGTLERIRNDQWRVFDFFWMLHTMDYQGRDDFNNMLLRAFSLLGLFTILSGFVLFFVSIRRI